MNRFTKGGKPHPYFYWCCAGAYSGRVLSGAQFDLMAALGFIAVFAAATNTPSHVPLGIELFGTEHVIYYAVACFAPLLFQRSFRHLPVTTNGCFQD